MMKNYKTQTIRHNILLEKPHNKTLPKKTHISKHVFSMFISWVNEWCTILAKKGKIFLSFRCLFRWEIKLIIQTVLYNMSSMYTLCLNYHSILHNKTLGHFCVYSASCLGKMILTLNVPSLSLTHNVSLSKQHITNKVLSTGLYL